MMIVFMIAVIVSIIGVFSANASSSSYRRGDADGDGTVTILDATVIQRELADLPVASFNEKAADVDGDGLNIIDATNIQRYLADFADPYHINEIVEEHTQPTQDEYELPFVPN